MRAGRGRAPPCSPGASASCCAAPGSPGAAAAPPARPCGAGRRHAAGAAILARLRRGRVVGFGGYPTRGAGAGRPPAARDAAAVVLHEQNAVLGRANRCLRALADLLALGFAGTHARAGRHATAVTGNPVRAGDRSAGRRAEPAAPTAASACWCWAARSARACSATWCRPPWRCCRRAARPAARRRSNAGPRTWRACAPPTPRPASRRSWRRSSPTWPRAWRGHLVIARAGASTVAELAVAGRPAMLVPLPTPSTTTRRPTPRAAGAVGDRAGRVHRGARWPPGLRLLGIPTRCAAAPASSPASAVPTRRAALGRRWSQPSPTRRSAA